jgi:agmatinase
MLGGEHSITLGMVRALSRFYSDLCVLVLDAHADFRESYHGNKYNHACVARRAAEVCPLVQVGIRSLSTEEAVALDKRNVTTLWAQEFRKSRCANDQSKLIRRLLKNLTAHVYVSIDADAFDPSIMPAVGTPEPGGLLWDEVLNVLRSVIEKRDVVGLDLVELAPIPGLIHPEFMGARLLYKTWGYALKPE